MNHDLAIIKNKYGEKMQKLCRELFPTLLETEGLLVSRLLKAFEPSHFLYDDIINNCLVEQFKNYIFSVADVKNNIQIIDKSPTELLEEAGYSLYECLTEEDIDQFKKYYEEGEELCTFKGERLNTCFVFFAVKKNVNQICRKNFPNPKREDEYGTSVISIQFSKGEMNTVSIKNRYNHIVNNPDATFFNNLDNIIPGLSQSFKREYGLNFDDIRIDFEIPN